MSVIIGIDASRAFVKNKTGIEEYAYQVIKNLRYKLKNTQVVLYTRPGGDEQVDFKLPAKWQVKVLPWKYLWTQGALSFEMLVNPIDVLFVPAHTLPFIYPAKSVVTIHGLEYEFSPRNYSFYSRMFHRFFIKNSCKWASEIISVSKKTKQDLVKMYKVDKKKIKIIPNGFFSDVKEVDLKADKFDKYGKFLFFIGRLEERKNIIGIIKTFEILKKKYKYEGKLLLGGKFGYGSNEIEKAINKSSYKKDIKVLGFVSDNDKWGLLKKADVFLFPSFSEGFGIPILEAQSMGTVVITSNKSPMKETVDDKRVVINPTKPAQIAAVVDEILNNSKVKKDIIRKGLINIKKYSWRETADEIAMVLRANLKV